jgi:Zn-dependent protease with chaperone function
LITSISNLIKKHHKIFIQDQLLALAVTGTILLFVKLSSGNSSYIIYFNLIYGCSIWLSSLVAHNTKMRNLSSPYWILMLIGFFFLSVSFDTGWRFLNLFVIYMGYWILFHKYTAEIQVNTPTDTIGSIIAARSLLMLFTLSVGELFGGYITRLIDLPTELMARGCICFFVLVYLWFSNKKLSKDKI